MTQNVMRVCGAVLCLLYGLSLATHLLAFLGLYRLESLLIAAPVSILGAGWLYTRSSTAWIKALFPADAEMPNARQRRFATYDRACLIAALVLLTLIFLLRVSLFPWSNVGALVSADAIDYHFPKSLELVRTGTLWDVSFLYAEYPIGYEGLVSAGVLLTGTVFPAGLIQALTIVLLVTTLALMIHRYSDLPVGMALLIISGLCLHPSLYGILLLIGKNDLLMTTALLVAVLHSPLTVSGGSRAFHPVGLAFATMIAMSVKATAFLPLGVLWGLVFWEWGQQWFTPASDKIDFVRKRVYDLVGLTLLMLPCGFWLIRNLAMMHRPFSPEVSSFFQGSLLANLTFPKLYSDGPESIMLIALIIWGVVFIGLAAWRGGWRIALMLVAFWAAFLITPLGVFHTLERHTVRVEWRYITHLFLFMAVLITASCAPLIMRVFEMGLRYPLRVALVLVILCGGLLVYIDPFSALIPQQQNIARLANPYVEANDSDYVSVYDYVRRAVQDSVVYYNGARPFFFYIPAETNRFMDVTPHPLGMPDLVPRPEPDYLVHIKDWSVAPQQWSLWDEYGWEIAYEDGMGVVYRRGE